MDDGDALEGMRKPAPVRHTGYVLTEPAEGVLAEIARLRVMSPAAVLSELVVREGVQILNAQLGNPLRA